jgi:hypothetical protein
MTATKKHCTGITAEQIVEAAVELTRQHGLYGSLRGPGRDQLRARPDQSLSS